MTHASNSRSNSRLSGQIPSSLLSVTRTWTDRAAATAPLPLSPVERSLVRLLALGYALEDAAGSVGLSPADADSLLRKLQNRCSVSSLSRLLALAVLRHWV